MTSRGGSDTISADRLLTPAGQLDGAWIAVRNGRVADAGRGEPPTGVGLRLTGGVVVPGFVDIHCHGGGGAAFDTSDPAEIRAAAAFHARHGTTSVVASMMTAPVSQLARALAAVADVVEAGDTTVVGSHLEGPFLSPARSGAQPVSAMVPPDPQVLRRLYEASRGTLRLLTLAPELDGALEVLDAAVALGVTVAIGHTDATYEQAAEAFARGASVASHLFNAMRPVHHRDPGPVVAAMSAGAGCELVVDGAHLHDAVPAMVFAHAIARPVLVTDAIAAAGLGRARLEVGGQPVTVSDGQARADGTGALAGSTLTLDEALRRAVRTCGVGLAEAVRAASATPARMLGLDAEVGSAGTGTRADLVHLDDELRVVRVLRAGRDVGPRG